METNLNNPNTNIARQQRARGLTLVELLVVMAILSLVTVATIPLMQPPTGERKIREAARNVATTFELARARATETGRPAGVWFTPLDKPGTNGEVESYKLFLCDVPPPYAGDSTTDTANITNSGNSFTLNGAGSAGTLCKYGDRIRFNYRGPYYKITGGTDGQLMTGTKNLLVGAAPDYYSAPPVANNVPFEIIRQPVKSSIAPTILATTPPASVVDLTKSGHGSDNTEFGNNTAGQPVIVTFTPSGRVHQVIHYQANGTMELEEPASTLFFLVRLRKETYAPLTELDSYWISINPFTGLVSVSPSVGGGSVTASRALAIQGRIEGGL